MNIAITGHTKGLGKSFYNLCVEKGHNTLGFSRSNGYDLRDYSKVTKMLEQITKFDVFINNAKPDYVQSQILYRLTREWDSGTIISIGSSVILRQPNWTDSYLLEYTTQKHALAHANRVLSTVSNCNLVLLNPDHLNDNIDNFSSQVLEQLKI